MDYVALKSEIDTDPTGLGLVALRNAGNDQGIADALNLVRQTINIDRDFVAGWEVVEAMVSAEYAALSTAEKTRIQTIIGAGTIYVKGTNTRAAFAAAFGAGTTTRANLLALQQRKGSRAEALWGAGVSVTNTDVSTAKGLA
jgi:hypothetical protein